MTERLDRSPRSDASPPIAGPFDRRATATLVAVALASTAVCTLVAGWWAATDGINADEGFYLEAARHVMEGRRLYADAFFPQMPYLPWLLAAVFSAFDLSLMTARWLSVGVTALGAGIIAGVAWMERRSLFVVIFFAVLYIANGLILNAFTIAKNHSLSSLGVMVALVALVYGAPRHRAWALVAGLMTAIAVGTRLAVVPVLPVLLFLAWRSGALAAYAAGAVIGSIPWLLAGLRNPDEFWFCNVAFHGLRREISGFAAIVAQKLPVLAKWFFLPQQLVLWALFVAALWRRPRRAAPAALCVAVLALAYVYATPTYLEYAAQLVPLVLLAAIPVADALDRQRMIPLVLLMVYLAGLYPFLKAPAPGSDLDAKRQLWRQETVQEVVRQIQLHSSAGDRVLSWWEGYPPLSDRAGFVGVGFWESNVAKKLSAQRARRYHVRSREEILELIRRREPALIVVPQGTWSTMRGVIAELYRPVGQVGAIEIHARGGS